MADVKLRVFGEDEATKILRNIDADLEKLANTSQEATAKQRNVFTELKGTYTDVRNILGDVYRVAQQAYQFISEGADLELAQMRFERLAGSIDTTAEALNTDLSKATRVLMSNAEQMQLAGDLMSLGLAKTHDEAVRLTNVAAQLGMNMNQLVLTLTNQTTMRFDALGVAVDGFDEKVAALEKQGYATDEAFKWAFIEQAEDQIERVGGIADTTAGQLMILESTFANLTDQIKRNSAELAGPAVKSLNDYLSAANQLDEAYETGRISLEQYLMINEKLSTSEEENAFWLDYLSVVAKQYYSDLSNISTKTDEVSKKNTTLAQVYDYSAEQAQFAAKANAQAAAAMEDASESASDANKDVASLAGSYASLSRNVGSATSNMQEQIDFIAAGGGSISVLLSAAEEALNAGDIGLAQKIADEASVAAADVQLELGQIDAEEAAQKIADDLGISFDEAQQMVADLETSLFNMTARDYFFNVGVQFSGTYTPGKPSAPSVPVPNTPEVGALMGGFGPSGGGVVNNYFIEIGYVNDGTDFFNVIAEAQLNASQDAASFAAGAGYVG